MYSELINHQSIPILGIRKSFPPQYFKVKTTFKIKNKHFNMKKYIIFTFLLALSQLGFTQSKIEKAKAEVEAMERQRFDAQVKKDYAFLDKVFADDLIYTHSGGKQDSKTTYIASIKEGKSVYDKINVESLTIRPYAGCKTAVVNGIITITQPTAEGKTVDIHLKYAVVYVKNKGKGWQLVMWQSLKLAS
jgi:ketosteroid isomerase-like protein